MKRFLLTAVLVAIVAVAFKTRARAAEGSGDEQAFLAQHVSDVVQVSPKRLDDPAIRAVIAAPVYQLTITINSGDGGSMTQTQPAARVGDKLVPLSRPGTDGDCPDLQKMLRPEFRLKSDAQAKALQSALNAMFPPVMDDEKKAIKFRHSGHDWQFIRGVFFDKPMGFVFTTDAQGKVTSVKYVLKLP